MKKNLLPLVTVFLLAACGGTTPGSQPGTNQPPRTNNPPTSTRDTTAPTVSLVTSATNVTSDQTLVLSAGASDNTAVTRVDFYHNGQLLLSDTSAPFETSIGLGVGMNGAHTFLVRAYDAAGNVNTATATVNVNIGAGQQPAPTPGRDVTPPNVSLTSSHATVTNTGSVELSAAAADNVRVTKVEFYDGNRLINTDTSAPFETSINFDRADNGTRTLTAKAFDAAGNVRASAPVSIKVDIPAPTESTPPTVSLSAATDTVTEKREVLLTADAADASGIAKVEFYMNGKLFHTETEAPYEHHHAFASDRQNGKHEFTARAYDKVGNAKTSAPVVITVDIPLPPDSVAPTVTLDADPSQVTAPGVVALKADAKDDRGVTKVEFYKGSRLVATDDDAPYEVPANVTSDDVGTVTFTATAFDEAGNTVTSAPANVTVTAPAAPPVPAVDMTVFKDAWRWVVDYNSLDINGDARGKIVWTTSPLKDGATTVVDGVRYECTNPFDHATCTQDGTARVSYDGSRLRFSMTHTEIDPIGDPNDPPPEKLVSFFDGYDADGVIDNSPQGWRLLGAGIVNTRQVDNGATFELQQIP